MELHQLRYFLAVVDEGTFTAAAERTRVSQSGVSTQIGKLERELGLALLDRSARRVSLTDAGARLVPVARSALAAVAEVTGTANEIRGLVTGSLEIGCVSGLVWPPLFDAIAALHRQHPGVDVRLHEGGSGDLVEEVRRGTSDVAVAAWAREAPAGLESTTVFDDPLVAVVSPEHAWSRRGRIARDDLVDEDLIALPEGTGARAALDALIGDASAAPRWEVATPAYVEMLAARGLGTGVVSATTAHRWTHLVRIPIASSRSRLGVVWRPGPSPAARALLARLDAVSRSGP